MDGGIRADVKIDSPASCPIASVSASTGGTSYSISKSVDPDGSGTVTEEFVIDAGDDPDLADLERSDRDVDVDEVFTYIDKDVYRFSREAGWECPCDSIERFDCPPLDVTTRDGSLFLAFHAPDMDTLQEVILTLRERYGNTDVRRLLRSDGNREDQHLVFVDRSKLTDRQREVLETAHRMGYFDHPKGANAGEVAGELDITTSTFTEHLSAAQRKLLAEILDE